MMTKRERAELDALREELAIYRALRWTAPVEPDMPIPEPFDARAYGWTYNHFSRVVDRAWTTSGTHALLTPDGRQCGWASQGGVALYSTRGKALAALRHAVEIQTANLLRKIDQQIADDQQEVAKLAEQRGGQS